MLKFVGVHFFGLLGALGAKKLKIPAGMFVGALVAAALFSTISHMPTYPKGILIAVKIASGALLGCRFSRKDVIELRTIFKQAFLLLILLFSWTYLFSNIMYKITDLNFITALLSCSPGGMTDIALISEDLGANVEVVLSFHLLRFIFLVTFLPLFIKSLVIKKMNLKIKEPLQENIKQKLQKNRLTICITFIIAATGGLLFYYLRIPAGALLGAMVFTALANIIFGGMYIPLKMRLIIQMCTGIALGTKVTQSGLITLSHMIFPAIILIIHILVMTFVTAFIIHKLTKMDFVTCLFAATPGGLQEIGLISESLGLDTPKIMALHTIRLITVLSLLPIVIRII